MNKKICIGLIIGCLIIFSTSIIYKFGCDEKKSKNNIVKNTDLSLTNETKINQESFFFEYDSTEVKILFDNGNDLEVKNYFKKIFDLETYNKYKIKFKLELELTEKDFENNFVLIAWGEKNKNYFVNEMYKKNNELNIEVFVNKGEFKTNGLCILVDKSLQCEEIDMYEFVKDFRMKKYTNLYKFEGKYVIDDARKESCVISDMVNKKTEKRELMDEFVNQVHEGRDAEIRIFCVNQNQTEIYDIQYDSINQKFNIGTSIEINGIYFYKAEEIFTNKIKKMERRSTEGFKTKNPYYEYDISENENINTVVIILYANE